MTNSNRNIDPITQYIITHRRLAYFARRINPPMYCKMIRKKIYDIKDRKINQKKVYIDIGGNYFVRRHWRIMDYPTSHYFFIPGIIDIKYDLTSGEKFPLNNNSVDLFFSSHTLEHVPQKYCQFIFNEIYRCLKDDGGVRLTMPDFDLAYNAYKKNNIDFFNMYDGTIEKRFLRYFASHLMENGGDEVRKKIQIMQKEEFANHYTLEVSRELVKKHEHEFHVNWWNFEKAYNMLKKSGFTKIYRSEQRKSKFKEMQSNLFDYTYPSFSLYIEAIK